MSKICQYTYIAGPRKGEKCNKLLRKPDGLCYRHKSQRGKQEEYKELIQDMKEKKNKNKIPQPIPEKKRLSNIVNRAIEEVIKQQPKQKEEVEEEVEEESIEDLEIEDIKPFTKPVIKKPVTKAPPTSPKKSDSTDDDLIDQCQHAVMSKLPIARQLITQMLKRELITDEEYDKLLQQLRQ